jgi:hypothetical protein
MAKVLRAFDYSFDGVTVLHASVDDDIDFGELSAGLAGEKFIEAGETSAGSPEPVVETVTETVAETVATPVVETVVTPAVENTPTTPAPAPKTRTSR